VGRADAGAEGVCCCLHSGLEVTGDEHYAEAERLVEKADLNFSPVAAIAIAAQAQVHATLALAFYTGHNTAIAADTYSLVALDHR